MAIHNLRTDESHWRGFRTHPETLSSTSRQVQEWSVSYCKHAVHCLFQNYVQREAAKSRGKTQLLKQQPLFLVGNARSLVYDTTRYSSSGEFLKLLYLLLMLWWWQIREMMWAIGERIHWHWTTVCLQLWSHDYIYLHFKSESRRFRIECMDLGGKLMSWARWNILHLTVNQHVSKSLLSWLCNYLWLLNKNHLLKWFTIMQIIWMCVRSMDLPLFIECVEYCVLPLLNVVTHVTAFVTFDQPLYLKAREIPASRNGDFNMQNFVIHLGDPLINVFYGSRRFYDHFIISTDKVMTGHEYTRTVTAHLLTHRT